MEHIFGHQTYRFGAGIIRTTGIMRSTFQIGLSNLVYNLSRVTELPARTC